MKYIIFSIFIFLLTNCDNTIIVPSYKVEFPSVPSEWLSLLGNPDWRLEWFDANAEKQVLEISGDQSPNIQILETWTTPIIAYPFWESRNIAPNFMYPAGALFPFDVSGDKIHLTWSGGVDAFLYLELASNFKEPEKGTPRYPHYFNWIRFRERFKGNGINENVKHDPWLADWKSIAVKTSQSGFDRRRIVPLSQKDVAIPIQYEGYWIGSSPFAKPIHQKKEEDLSLKLSEKTETYISTLGILRCTKNIWILIPFK